jgi:hypothetical protein
MAKIYISGMISGIEEEAPRLFENAEIQIKNAGFEPVNPMKLKHDHDKTWESYMKEDLKALFDCDGIFVLGNWIDSKGARIELDLAFKLNIPVYRFFGSELKPITKPTKK